METVVCQMFWGCCECPSLSAFSGGLTSFIDFCPECGHERCLGCQWGGQEDLFKDVRVKLSTQLNNSTESQLGTETNTIFPGPPVQTLPRSEERSRAYQREVEQNDSTREKQQPKRRRSNRHGSNTKTTSGKTFACHFCKRSPQLYNPWIGDDRYLKCLYPKPDGLRRIKDHFNQNHSLQYFRCRSCYTIFEDENDLLCHEQSFAACSLTSAPPIDGIDIGQMRRIEIVLKARTDKWKSDSQKWFDIWAILFPGDRPPKTPYSEPPMWSSAALLTEVEYTAELKYELQLLKRDEQSHSKWIGIFKEALDSILDSYQEIKNDPQSAEDIADMDDTKQFDSIDFCHGGDCKAESAVKEDSRDPHEPLKTNALSGWEYADFVHSIPSMDFQGGKLLQVEEQSFTSPHLPPPSIIEYSAMGYLKAKAYPASNCWPSSPAQDTTAINSNSYGPPDTLNIDNTLLTSEDLFDFRQGPNSESRDLMPEITDFRHLFETSEHDCDTYFTVFEDDFESGIESYINSHDIEGLLAFESQQPSANGPISHIRDMNKGLKGRYEFDGSM